MTSVSVVMSVYNGESNVKKTIYSVLNQSFEEFEFVIVNDASKDNTKQIIEEIATKDNRIKLIHNKINLGLSKSLYNAVKIAQGNYIARIDSGDMMYRERIEIQKGILDNDIEKKVGIVTTNCEVLYMGDGEVKQSVVIVPKTNIEILRSMPFKNVIPHVSVMFRKDIYNLAGGYDTNLKTSQDGDLWSRMLKISEVYSHQQILTKIIYDKTIESISIHKNKEQRKNAIKISLRSLQLGTYPQHLTILGLFKKLIIFLIPKFIMDKLNTIKFNKRRKL